MRRDSVIQLVALGLMLAFLSASVVLTGKVSASMGRNRLVYADSTEGTDNKLEALGIAMGAFRGVFVNYLWIRANALKEDGKYYEAVDLAKTITRLQPRFPKVWAFHAWNLAYNISVTTQTPQERWHWVQAGINLLRDEGIPANPNDLVLHKELAWIFLHKVEGFMDDAQQYYKRALAREWTVVMGSPPKRILGSVADSQADRRLFVDHWLAPIASAPDTIEEVYKQQPLARELAARIKSEAGLNLDKGFLERIALITSFLESAQSLPGMAPEISDPLAALMAEPKYHEAGKLLVNYTRKRVLVDEYHMEPERMIRYTLKFGPIDWRHPAAHALYWSARGVEEAGPRVNTTNRSDFDFVNTDRVVVQSVQALFRSGLLFYDITNPQMYLALPDVDFLDSYAAYREEALSRAGVFESKTRRWTEYTAGLENFWRDAIRFLYRRGDRAKAEEYYRKLRTAPWLPMNDPEKIYRDYGRTLDEFVVHEITDENRITSPTVALQEISGALEAAYLEGLLGGDMQVFDSNFKYARMFHAEYQKSQSFRTWVAGSQGRLGFPPFDFFSSQLLSGVIMTVGIPQGPIIYNNAPPELRARAYVFLSASQWKKTIDATAAQGAPAFDTWFPPPRNVDQVREELRKFMQQGVEKGNTELK